MLVIEHLYLPCGQEGNVQECGVASLMRRNLPAELPRWSISELVKKRASGYLLPALQEPAVSVSGTLQRDARLQWRPFLGGI